MIGFPWRGINMLLISLLIVAQALAEKTYQCGVTPEWEAERIQEIEQQRKLQTAPALKRSSTLGSFRIYVHYLDMSALAAADVTSIKETIMPGVVNWYRNVIRVYNLAENWRLSQTTCSSQVQVPAVHQSPGLPNVDLVVYAYAVNEPNKNYVAKGGFCALDGNALQNPLAGTLGFNAAQYVSMATELAIMVCRHEIFHLLGFSPSMWPYYKQQDGTLYQSYQTSTTVRDLTVTMLTTPKMLARAKSAFGCQNMVGLELENTGQTGTAGSHWDKRVMRDDFMTGTLSLDSIYSDVTLALLEDSSWYTVNYDYTDPISFGRNKGCDWFTKKCVIGGISQFPEWCTVTSNNQCNYQSTRKGSCNLYTFSTAVPTVYQYFTDPLVGGTDTYADYCPYVESFGNGDCRGYGTQTTYYQPVLYGEQICDTCRCFVGNYIIPNRVQKVHSGCHAVTCSGGVATVQVGAATITCPVAGGDVTTIPGFIGSITCPPYDILCGPHMCVNSCFGYGKCVNGNCVCDEGHFGADCTKVCDYTCKTCTGAANNQCLSCFSTATFAGGVCTCPSRQYLEKTTLTCTACNTSCVECSGPLSTNCLSCVTNASVGLDGSCVCTAGYYLDVTVCKSCEATCQTCSSLNTCLTCKVAAATVSGGACVCPSHQFISADGTTCTECHGSCATCSGPLATNCLTCNANGTLQSDKSCLCNAGYYVTTTGLCGTCNLLCKTCSGGLASNCLSCKPLTATLVSNVCTCPTHQFLTTDGAQCAECSLSCKTCNSGLTTSCLSCYVNATLQPSNSCLCDDGYYQMSGGSCGACNAQCKTCNGGLASNCLTCKTTSATVVNGTCTCPSPQNLSSDGTACTSCHITCKTCTGTSASTCVTCWNNASLVGSTCKCSTGYYQNAEGSCSACQVSCANCDSDSKCNSCKVAAATISGGGCTCPSHQYMSTDGSACLTCNATCQNCSGELASNCTSCPANATLQTGNTCLCNSGYYLAGDGSCPGCHTNCLTCNGGLGTNCMTCRAPTATPTSGVCVCPAHQFLSTDGSQCSECSVFCQSCGGALPNQCLSCNTNASLQGDKTCTCNGGYYQKSDGSCGSCNTFCATCSGPLSSNCLSCKPQTATVQNNVCTCPTHQFLTTDGSQCSECSATCKSCSGSLSTNCLTCHANASLQTGSVCVCATGYFPATDGTCGTCNTLCKACTGALAANCLTCKPLTATVVSGVCTCPSSQYLSADGSQCAACVSSCLTCDGGLATNCLSCRTNATLQTNKSCLCAAGYYMNTLGTCTQCSVSCASCTSDTVCVSCKAPTATVSGGGCVCPLQQSMSTDGTTCSSCDPTCQSCNGPLPTNCLTCLANASLQSNSSCLCNAGFYREVGGECSGCSVLCKTCNGASPSNCLSCKPATATIVNNACTCASGQYLTSDGSQCAACESSCQTCNGPLATNCVTCWPNATKQANSSCLCGTSFYKTAEGKCGACLTDCLTCANNYSCLTCRAGTPTCNCPTKTYQAAGGMCVDCYFSCASCQGPAATDCLDCPAHATKQVNNSCVCDSGYYTQSDGNCGACSPYCKTCNGSSASNCQSCKIPAQTIVSGACVCPVSTYLSADLMSCFPCNFRCYSCSGSYSTNCLSCFEHATYNEYWGTCTCDDGYYLSLEGCPKCASDCATCSSATYCKTCSLPGAVALYGTCKCPYGYYTTTVDPQCAKCDFSCATCSGPSPTNCLTCKIGATLNEDWSCQCSNGYYLKADGYCGACLYECATCSDPMTCSTCKASTAFLTDGLCTCPSNQVMSTYRDYCFNCYYACNTCNKPYSTGCLTCHDNAVLSRGVCFCKSGYYMAADGSCDICGAGCYSCKNEQICYSCWAYNAQLTGGKCLCRTGLYMSPDGLRCLPCDTSCLTCVGPLATECSLCQTGTHLAATAPSSCVARRLTAMENETIHIAEEEFVGGSQWGPVEAAGTLAVLAIVISALLAAVDNKAAVLQDSPSGPFLRQWRESHLLLSLLTATRRRWSKWLVFSASLSAQFSFIGYFLQPSEAQLALQSLCLGFLLSVLLTAFTRRSSLLSAVALCGIAGTVIGAATAVCIHRAYEITDQDWEQWSTLAAKTFALEVAGSQSLLALLATMSVRTVAVRSS